MPQAMSRALKTSRWPGTSDCVSAQAGSAGNKNNAETAVPVLNGVRKLTNEELMAREQIRHTLASYNKFGDAEDAHGFATWRPFHGRRFARRLGPSAI